ncbi:MAG: CHAD domain-containing protein [Deltaproteobacteria bacterium]|nr:CHAD domain-containing protein [Deltaproteobacteria bacterium]
MSAATDPTSELEPSIALRLAPFVAERPWTAASDAMRAQEPKDPLGRADAAAGRIARELDLFVGGARVEAVEVDWQPSAHRYVVLGVVPGRDPDRVSTTALEAELERVMGVPIAVELAPSSLEPPHVEAELRASAAAARTLMRLMVRAHARSRGAVLSEDDEEVHQLRVGFRRLRGASRMLRRAFAHDVQPRFVRAMEVARRAMQRAGDVRDLDVLLDDLKWAEKRAATPDDSVRALRDTIRARRDKALRPMRRFLESHAYATGIARLSQLLRALADDDTRGGAHADAFARKRFRKEELRCATAIHTLDVGQLEQAHAIRIAAKRMRYCAELVRGIVGRAEGVSRAASDVQSTLGRERDAARAMDEIDAAIARRAIRPTAAIVAMTAALAMRRVEATTSARWALAALRDALQ